MTRKLRVVNADSDMPERSFNDDARDAWEKILALNPIGLCILYETSDMVTWATIPDSQALECGLIEICHNTLNSPMEE
jgi:hypothetical protein